MNHRLKVEFLQDIEKAYSLIGNGKYIPLGTLKENIPNRYWKDFSNLLKQARILYPDKIWIDKDSRGQTIVKIIPWRWSASGPSGYK